VSLRSILKPQPDLWSWDQFLAEDLIGDLTIKSVIWGLFFKATLQVFTLHSTLYSAKLAETVFLPGFFCAGTLQISNTKNKNTSAEWKLGSEDLQSSFKKQAPAQHCTQHQVWRPWVRLGAMCLTPETRSWHGIDSGVSSKRRSALLIFRLQLSISCKPLGGWIRSFRAGVH